MKEETRIIHQWSNMA